MVENFFLCVCLSPKILYLTVQVSEGLYKKLHAYVRMRLRETYPDKISSTGLIPAHILGMYVVYIHPCHVRKILLT